MVCTGLVSDEVITDAGVSVTIIVAGAKEGVGDGSREGTEEVDAGEGPDVHPAMNVREIMMTMAHSTFLFIFYHRSL